MSEQAFRKILRSMKETILIARGVKNTARLYEFCEIEQSIHARQRGHEATREMGGRVTRHHTKL